MQMGRSGGRETLLQSLAWLRLRLFQILLHEYQHFPVLFGRRRRVRHFTSARADLERATSTFTPPRLPMISLLRLGAEISPISQ